MSHNVENLSIFRLISIRFYYSTFNSRMYSKLLVSKVGNRIRNLTSDIHPSILNIIRDLISQSPININKSSVTIFMKYTKLSTIIENLIISPHTNYSIRLSHMRYERSTTRPTIYIINIKNGKYQIISDTLHGSMVIEIVVTNDYLSLISDFKYYYHNRVIIPENLKESQSLEIFKMLGNHNI